LVEHLGSAKKKVVTLHVIEHTVSHELNLLCRASSVEKIAGGVLSKVSKGPHSERT